ncbi:MAG: lipopolysaccharide biosynthesis protein [Promethearchaeota archaeon]
MKHRLKQLGKDSLIYGIGGVLAKGISFFLLPVYTRIFTPADYGTIEMLTVLNSFLGSILVMGMDSAQSFYFFEQKKQSQDAQAKVVTSILQWRIIWGATIVLIATLISPLLNKHFFNGQLSWEYFAIAFVGTLFAQIMSQSAEVYRLLYRPWSYISVTLGQAMISAAIAITLIVCLGLGILGFFIGMLMGSILAAFFGWWRIRNYLNFSRWHSNWWPRLIKFGAPLVPAGLAIYVLNTADRWFINYYHDQHALGLYAVGAKFAMFIAVAVTTFRQAWWPVAMDAMHSEDGPALYRTIARLYMGVGSACIVILTAMSPYLVRWFTIPAYFQAYPIVGILSWYSIFYGFYLIGAAGIWKSEKTILAPVLSGLAALLNIGLNAWLVPHFGGIGAALATSASFGIWAVLALFVSERLWIVRYDYSIMGMQVALGAVICYVILMMYNQGQSLFPVAIVSTFAIVLLILLSVTRNHLKKAYKILIREI